MADRHKQLLKMLRDKNNFRDGLSENDDNQVDVGFVPPTPRQPGIRKLFSPI